MQSIRTKYIVNNLEICLYKKFIYIYILFIIFLKKRSEKFEVHLVKIDCSYSY